MSKSFPTLLFLTLNTLVYSEDEHYNYLNQKDDKFFNENFYCKYVVLSCGIFVLIIIRHVIKSYEIPVPYQVFCILFGIICGVGCVFSTEMKTYLFVIISPRIEQHINDIYLPALLFYVGFSVDNHSFMKSISQIMVVAVVVGLLSATMTGMMMRPIIDGTWTQTDAFLFGVVSLAINPMNILTFLKESSVQIKYVTTLLQGETLFSTIVAVMTYNIIVMNEGKEVYVTYWYHYVSYIVRSLLFQPPIGYLLGLLGTFLMKVTYNDIPYLLILSFSICFVSYYFARYIAECGAISTVIVAVMMSAERSVVLSKEAENTVKTAWKVIIFLLNGYVALLMGILLPPACSGLPFHEIFMVVVTYITVNITRFMCFFVLSPILSRRGYGMSFKNMIVCVWSGLRNPICISMVIELRKSFETKKGNRFFLHTAGLYVLFQLINGSSLQLLLQTLGLREISLTRQTTMNNCMKFIYEARARTIAILKMDRFLSDANWPLVMTSTSLKHPYKKLHQIAEESQGEKQEEDYLINYRYTYCPDCEKQILNEPSPKEMLEMTKEAKTRILKFKKTAYSRQFENGMISTRGIRILHQTVELAMDSEELFIELEGLFAMFTAENIFYKSLQTRFLDIVMTKQQNIKSPRRKWMLKIHYIVNQWWWKFLQNFLVILNIILSFLYIFLPPGEFLSDNIYLDIYFLYSIIYSAEFVIEVITLTWKQLCRDGFKNYFSQFWSLLRFFILCITVVETIIQLVSISIDQPHSIFYVQYCLLALHFLRLTQLVFWFSSVNQLPVIFLKYLDKKVNKHKLLAFELGKTYIAGEEEILENLSQIVDNVKIRQTMRDHTEIDRHAVYRRIALAQKQKAWVASTVKTVASMRAVLNSIKDEIHELKISGFIDEVEHRKLLFSLFEKYKLISSIQLIEPSSPRMIFRELPFMGEDDDVVEFLYNHLMTRKYDPGDRVLTCGQPSNGIIILITGMLVVNYNPDDATLEKLKDYGTLPVIDYMCSMSYYEPIYEYWIPGNTLGELSTLTKRPYDGSISAETHSEVYFLHANVIKKAMEMDSDPITGFECRLWKFTAFRLAVNILTNVPSYRSLTQEKIKYILERGFVPDLSNYKIFVINNMMQDIILIEGIVVDFNTRDTFVAPCYIPRAVQKLIFPRSSSIYVETDIETKLMIIPAKNFDEYEIMLKEEEVCELVSYDSSKCLTTLIHASMSITSSKTSKLSKIHKQHLKKSW